jgi:hypothetical protein
MADAPCKRNRGRHGCQEIVTEGGVDDSGFCENCWYPTVVQDHAKYHELIAEGYSRTQAALLSGLADPEEFEENKGPHKLGTAPITAVTQERDDDCDEEMQEELTSSILDRLNEDDQSQ